MFIKVLALTLSLFVKNFYYNKRYGFFVSIKFTLLLSLKKVMFFGLNFFKKKLSINILLFVIVPLTNCINKFFKRFIIF